MLQGAWIHVRVKQDRDALHQAFHDLDPTKVHFAIFGGWDAEAYVLARAESDKSFLMEFFDLEESTSFLIEDMGEV
ncbi:MAG: hypothetical protein ACE5LD_03220 [Candidatus Bipolaricaulia bacterium]